LLQKLCGIISIGGKNEEICNFIKWLEKNVEICRAVCEIRGVKFAERNGILISV
jgi:hypothetical protein